MKNKKIILFIFIILLTVGSTLAYFTSSSVLENELTASKYKTVTTEQFTSPSNWSPGDTTPLTTITTNQKSTPVVVRVKLEESWVSENGDPLPLTYNNERVAIINLDNTSDWRFDGTYYYYVNELDQGESTTSPIESVTYNPNTPSDMECTELNGVYHCVSTGDGYDGATYTLNIITETTQAASYQSIWGVDISKIVTPNPCTFNGTLTQGAEYVNGQYTYRYLQHIDYNNDLSEYTWVNISTEDGWGVQITDPTSTDPVTTTLCTSINDKPISYMSGMFYSSSASSIDFSSFDTSNVVDMRYMFYQSETSTLDLSIFNTSNVTNMAGMFIGSEAISLDLSSFDTSNVEDMHQMFAWSLATTINLSSFDTTNLEDAEKMFWGSQATTLDLSSFTTNSTMQMDDMFADSQATTGYCKTQEDCTRFNATTNKPNTLTFTVKSN